MPPRRDAAHVDDRCEGCDCSVAERFPGDQPPAFCEACNDEFRRCLKAGKVRYVLSGEVMVPA